LGGGMLFTFELREEGLLLKPLLKTKVTRKIEYCPVCGHKLSPDAAFCPNCGATLTKKRH